MIGVRVCDYISLEENLRFKSRRSGFVIYLFFRELEPEHGGGKTN